MDTEKFTVVEQKYLAEALAYIGFRYYKFTENEKTIYSFVRSNQLDMAINKLRILKKEFN